MRVKVFKKGSDPDWKIKKNKKNRTKVKPQWIPVQKYKDGIYNSIPSKTYYVCSNCGRRSFYQLDNCPNCNMKLKKTDC